MSIWGHLAERYETERPRKLLALDGGGIRGILTLEVLAKIESLLAQATGKGSAFRLCDFFDYIAGTSTGAIIAAGLACGMSTQELLTFYQQTGPAMFDKAFLLQRIKSLYKSEPLAQELRKTFSKEVDGEIRDRTLAPDDLCCLFLAVTRNVTTDSPWPISLGDLTRSDHALQRMLDQKGLEPGLRAETYALLGRNAKARWKNDWNAEPTLPARREKALRSPFLDPSYEAYSRAFANDLNHFYSGLNALAMLTISTALAQELPEVWSERFEQDREAANALEERQERRAKLAAAVELSIAAAQDRLRHEEKTDLWVEISAADLSCLTSKRPARVADAYRRALAGAPDFTKGAVRDQLRIYQDLDILTANVQAALATLGPAPDDESTPVTPSTPARVLLFTGHRIDEPGRAKPRFPPEKEEVARQEIRRAVERERPGGVAFGIAGGASGGDILFHEVCAELGIPTHLFLALPKNEYIEESVAPARGDWVRRFDRLAEQLPVRVLAHSKKLPDWLAEKKDYGIWQRNNLWMLENALTAGGENVTLIALWNGQEGDGPGGTKDLVDRATARHARIVILDTEKLFA